MTTNPYPQRDAPAAVEAEKPKGRGRPEPEAATARMDAARRHRVKFVAERNELLAWLTRLYPSHHMPPTDNFRTVATDRGKARQRGRRVICIHHPAVEPGQLCWFVSQEEIDEQFPMLKATDDNHWEKLKTTHTQRSEILKTIDTPKPKPKRAKPFKIAIPNPKPLTTARARALVTAKAGKKRSR